MQCFSLYTFAKSTTQKSWPYWSWSRSNWAKIRQRSEKKKKASKMVEGDNRLPQDYDLLNESGMVSSIMRPMAEANSFKLKIILVNLGTRSTEQSPIEKCTDLWFLRKLDTIKFNEVSIDAIWLRVFPFSLKDNAKYWLWMRTWHIFYVGFTIQSPILRSSTSPTSIKSKGSCHCYHDN